MRVFAKPLVLNVQINNPAAGRALRPEGEFVERDAYWARLAKHGVVSLTKQPDARGVVDDTED